MTTSSIYTIEKIKKCIEKSSLTELVQAIEDGFVMYSQGKVNVPPAGHLSFCEPPGDIHIKFGGIESDDVYVVKIASGFYNNPSQGLPTGNGLMLLFNRKTGQLLSVLLDEGYLTDIRTAIAGIITVKYMAPSSINCIGIVGTGTHARLQLEYLKAYTGCRTVVVWGRNDQRLNDYISTMKLSGFDITGTKSIEFLAEKANLIITTTASREPLLFGHHIRPGTHITAMGADSAGKQELGTSVFEMADIIAADSVEQCTLFGDLSYAVKQDPTIIARVNELGEIISNKEFQRKNDSQITVADLTGVAIQDIQISKYVYDKITNI